jgi:hypothetical protein
MIDLAEGATGEGRGAAQLEGTKDVEHNEWNICIIYSPLTKRKKEEKERMRAGASGLVQSSNLWLLRANG